MFLKQAIENVKFSTVVFKEANGHAAQNALARRGGGRREEREEGREGGRGGRDPRREAFAVGCPHTGR